MKTVTHKSPIPGITYEVKHVGSYKYVTILHHSGTPVISFTSKPVKRVTDVFKAANEHLKGIDWTGREDECTSPTHYAAYCKLRDAVRDI